MAAEVDDDDDDDDEGEKSRLMLAPITRLRGAMPPSEWPPMLLLLVMERR